MVSLFRVVVVDVLWVLTRVELRSFFAEEPRWLEGVTLLFCEGFTVAFLFPRIRDLAGDFEGAGLVVTDLLLVDLIDYWLLFDGVLLRWDLVGVTLASVSLDFFLVLTCDPFRSRCRVTDFFAGFPLGS